MTTTENTIAVASRSVFDGIMDAPKQTDAAGRTRLIIDTTEMIRRAVKLRALKEGVRQLEEVSHSDIVNAILAEALADEISEIESANRKKAKKSGQ